MKRGGAPRSGAATLGDTAMLKHLMLLSIAAGACLAGPSFGHAKLLSSSPANGAQVIAVPRTLTLSFSEEAKLASLILVRAGKETSLPLDETTAAARSMVVGLPVLAPGSYEVRWTAMSTDDGHITKGAITFTVLAAP